MEGNELGLITDHLAVAQALGHESVAQYQSWHGLQADDWAGPVTDGHMSQPRCGLPDVMRAGGADDVWPQACRTVPTAFDMRLNVSQSTIEDAWDTALELWNSNCGINLTRVQHLNAAKIWARSGPLRGSTLAWSYLPEGRCSDRLEQRYDTTVTWNREFLAKVILHEVGHAIGLLHSQSQADIMYPSITNRPLSSYPSSGDIRRVVNFYGPHDEPPPPGPDGATLHVTDTLQPGIYKVIKQ